MPGRLERTDWLLIGTLVPLCAVTILLHVRGVVTTGMARMPLLVTPAASPAEYPRATPHREVAGRGPGMLEIQAGDPLLQVGATDLRGVGIIGFEAIVRDQAGTKDSVVVRFEHDGELRSTVLKMAPSVLPGSQIPFQLGFLGIALFILLRAPGTRQARLFFMASCAEILWHTRFHGSEALSYTSLLMVEVVAAPAMAATLYWAIHFPAEVPRSRRLPRALVLIAVAWPLSRASRYLGGPLSIEQSQIARALSEVAFLVALLGTLSWNYYWADPIGRRRIKWILVGMYIGVLPILLALSLTAVLPDFAYFDRMVALGWILLVAMPITTLLAVQRYNLFDIDRVISAAASYSALGVVGAGLALGALPRIANAASDIVGIDASALQIVLGAGVLALVLPLHRRLQPRLDRIFLPERHALEQGFGSLMEAIAATRDTRDLAQMVGERLHRLLRPQSCAGYAPTLEPSSPYVPIFVYGRAVPPRFERESPLIARLDRNAQPLLLDRPAASGLGLEYSELERLGAAVLVPLRRTGLIGFLYLGAKQSGDVYTSTDLALLTAAASAVSARLLAFDENAVVEASRTMQDALRRYVPGAVADRLMAGQSIESGEREVSVLFVDIRGYTQLSQSRRAEEIFSLVNRYTGTVSEIVRKHGGSVVEFAGDGLMAVFGAPQELPQKECAAVATALEVHQAVAALEVDVEPGKRIKLSAGVGVATGLAFVGSIQSTDRLIWSAIGNTTNLAARLQSLTRDMDAAIVIDDTTRQRAHELTESFHEHRETAIKGRRDTETVYALPLAA